MSVVIGVPCMDEVKAWFAYDLAKLTAHTAAIGPQLRMLMATGCYLPRSRELIVNALRPDDTHLLFLDADMRFPPDTLMRLLAHDKPVVAAGYTERGEPFRPVVWDVAGDRVYTEPGDTGLRPVSAIGFGVILIQTAVLRKLAQPRFMVGWVRETAEFAGEDIYFCRKLEEAGIPLFLDHDLTKEVAHIGAFEFTAQHALNVRAEKEPHGDATTPVVH